MKRLLFLLLFLSACQTSPDKEAVSQPEDSLSVSTAKNEAKAALVLQSTLVDSATAPGDSAEDWPDSWPQEEWQEPAPPSYTSREVVKTAKWQQVGKGMEYALLPAPLKCSIGDSQIDVLRIDPMAVNIRLKSARFEDGQKQTADAWGRDHQLLALINAGMFNLSNGMTCTGMMRDYEQVNNPTLNGSYNLVAAFNPKDSSDPAFRFIDLRCEDWDMWKDRYHSYVQGIRIVDCNRKNRWSKQEKFWSMVLLGRDSKGRALFIFSRSPYRVHDLANMLLDLPIDLQQLMYLEGGPESSFWLSTPTLSVTKMGSYETDFMLSDDNDDFWGIPNIIAVSQKP